jgi:ribonuclease P protein component
VTALRVGRVLCSSIFERALQTKALATSSHFAVHFLDVCSFSEHQSQAKNRKLEAISKALTKLRLPHLSSPRLWLGFVVPKRHAKRSVTRNLIRRQIRPAMSAHSPSLGSGVWIVRLRSSFDARQFHSASSEAFKCYMSSELKLLFDTAVQKMPLERFPFE